jgi:hypothetical protein
MFAYHQQFAPGQPVDIGMSPVNTQVLPFETTLCQHEGASGMLFIRGFEYLSTKTTGPTMTTMFLYTKLEKKHLRNVTPDLGRNRS